MGLALAREHEAQRLLRAGLADRAGDGDDSGLQFGAACGARMLHRLQHIRHDGEGACAFKLPCMSLVDHGERRALVERSLDEVMAVAGLAGDGEEDVARLKRAGVDRGAGYDRRHGALGPRTQRRDQLVSGPERAAHLVISDSALRTTS